MENKEMGPEFPAKFCCFKMEGFAFEITEVCDIVSGEILKITGDGEPNEIPNGS